MSEAKHNLNVLKGQAETKEAALEEYQQKVKDAITKYNKLHKGKNYNPTTFKINNMQTPAQELITDLYQYSVDYLKKVHGITNVPFKVIHCYRHGECTNFDKGMGLKANANINAKAAKTMESFDY